MATAIISTIYFLLAVFYTFWAARILYGWRMFVQANKIHQIDNLLQGISVVVAFRNEEQNLPKLLAHLSALDYPPEKVEVILVDDHSTDAGVSIVKSFLVQFPLINIKLISTQKTGKKWAQREGINAAIFDIIACTDADCLPHQQWLRACNRTFMNENIELAFGSVVMHGSIWQAIEFCSLMGSTLAMLSLQWPVMGNGANMVVRKSAYKKAFPDTTGLNLASGDDVFLLHQIGKSAGKIGVLKGEDSFVKTSAQPTLRHFFWQRIRWAGKTSAYQSIHAICVAALVFLVNLALISSLLLFLLVDFYGPFLFLALVKLAADFILLRKFCKYYQVDFKLTTFVALEIFNLIYIPGVAVLSQILKYPWKGRVYSSLKNARTSLPDGD